MKARDDPRAVLDHLFSRGVLGSMLVGTAVGKTVEKAIILAAGPSTVGRLAAWVVALLVFIKLYAVWTDLEGAVSDAADAVDAGDDD